MATIRRQLIDIGANLTDPMFRGIYYGSRKHPDDLESVLNRAQQQGIEKATSDRNTNKGIPHSLSALTMESLYGYLIVTGGNLEDSAAALQLANQKSFLFSTVGCHPTHCTQFEKDGNPSEYLQKLHKLAECNSHKVVAIGEFGLDYDRLEFCPKDIQLKYFEEQLSIAEKTKLPLFLHCRNAANDLTEVLRRNRSRFTNGVVHSFDGSKSDAQNILDLGLYIGINGCSLKTPENLEVIMTLPANRIMIETDCPWCEIRPTHASYKHKKTVFPSVKKEKWKEDSQVKGRNEPANLVQILEVLASIRHEDQDNLACTIYENTRLVFFPDK